MGLAQESDLDLGGGAIAFHLRLADGERHAARILTVDERREIERAHLAAVGPDDAVGLVQQRRQVVREGLPVIEARVGIEILPVLLVGGDLIVDRFEQRLGIVKGGDRRRHRGSSDQQQAHESKVAHQLNQNT